jgi:VanZ family protein
MRNNRVADNEDEMVQVFSHNPRQVSANAEADWRWLLRVWSPVAVAIAVICVESTRTFSSQNTSSWLRPIFQHWFGAIQDTTWDLFHHYLRKTGHFVGYGTVALTFLRAWLHTLAKRGAATLLAWRLEASILAIFSTVVVAGCDEFHQTFLPGRTGTPIDVLLDTCGATTLCLLVWLICWSRRTQAQEA